MMNNSMKKRLSVILCIVLIAAMALCATGCTDTELPAHPTDPTSTPAEAATFTFMVVDLEGKETSFEVPADGETVGEALLAQGLIAGEEGEYGLYVKEVNGIVADYDTDGTYWAFHINGEYALTGVDTTQIAPDTVYSFVLTKG